VKKGRHRRFEEARALKRSDNVDLEGLFESISEDADEPERKPEHDAWADVAEEWERQSEPGAPES
jgi:hypothetical protein